MGQKSSLEARVVDFFERAPLEVARAVFGIVRTRMRERAGRGRPKQKRAVRRRAAVSAVASEG